MGEKLIALVYKEEEKNCAHYSQCLFFASKEGGVDIYVT
jgi:hypothetical protein